MGGRRAKALLAVAAVAALAVLGALALGVASGEGPAGSDGARSVSVGGVGVVPIGTDDNAAQATAVYREAMAKALSDGQSKAAYLAEKSGVALGAVTSIVEDGGYIECTGSEGREYGDYEGEQPDFGYGHDPSTTVLGAGATPEAAASPMASAKSGAQVSHRPVVKKKKKRKRRLTAHKSSTDVRCNLTANVAEIYALG